MSQLALLIPITAIAIGPVTWIANNYIRARHGYAPRDYKEKGDPDAERQIELLSTENGRLTGQVSRLEERIAVLERIVTDPAGRLEREIEALRSPATAPVREAAR